MDYGGGDKYVGEWRRGKEHGAGQLYKKGVATVVTCYNGVLGLVNERAKAGLYTGEDGKSADGIFITNVYDENKVRLLKIASSGQQNRLIIKFYQT